MFGTTNVTGCGGGQVIESEYTREVAINQSRGTAIILPIMEENPGGNPVGIEKEEQPSFGIMRFPRKTTKKTSNQKRTPV